MRVLVVDDDYYSRSFLEYILYPYAQCLTAQDGEEAVQIFKQALHSGEPIDVVCLDILMPVSDGPSALAEIREIERENGINRENGVKIIITSVLENDENIHNAMYLGQSVFLQKPISEGALLNTLRKLGILPQE